MTTASPPKFESVKRNRNRNRNWNRNRNLKTEPNQKEKMQSKATATTTTTIEISTRILRTFQANFIRLMFYYEINRKRPGPDLAWLSACQREREREIQSNPIRSDPLTTTGARVQNSMSKSKLKLKSQVASSRARRPQKGSKNNNNKKLKSARKPKIIVDCPLGTTRH